MKESLNTKWEIISSRLAGDSILDDKEFNAWLDSDGGNRALWIELKALWNRSYEAGLLHKINVQDGWSNMSMRIIQAKKKRIKRHFYIGIAVTLLLFIGVSVTLGYMLLKPDMQWERFAASGQNYSSITLADGSVVDVNRGGEFYYQAPFSTFERRVRLKGEAFFNVKGNHDAPFYIEAGQFRIRVVGTAFNVRNTGNCFEVNVAKGLVVVQNLKVENDILILQGGESVRFDHGTKILIRQDDLNSNYDAWKTRQILFRNNNLRSVCQTLESVYGIHVDIADDVSVDSPKLTASFSHDDLANVLHVIEVTLDVEFQPMGENQFLLTHSR